MKKYGNVFIKNIYYMLSYAFTALHQENFEDKPVPPGAKQENRIFMGMQASATLRWFIPIVYLDRWITD